MRPLRVRRPALKVLFVVAVLLASSLAVGAMSSSNVPGGPIVGTVIAFAAWIPLVRCLRGRDEPFLPPRPWWRATYRPTASILLAALFSLSVIVTVGETAAGVVPNPFTAAGDAAYFAFDSLLTLAQAAYFTVSAVMLVRQRGRSLPPA